ncbi:MAG: hydrogenase [Acidobacteriota bacterium]
MSFLADPQFGDKIVTLMAAAVLVLQIAMSGHRWLVTNIRIFGAQSFLLALIAAAIGWYNHAPHLYFAALLTLALKGIFVPLLLERVVERAGIRQEIRPVVNVPLSIAICGSLTLVGYTVAEAFHPPEGAVSPAVAISLFLIGFFMMLNRRKALTQALALLSLENGLFLAAISLTYGMPLIVEIGVFFDVLVAVMVLGVLVGRIREAFDSMDVSKLDQLRG